MEVVKAFNYNKLHTEIVIKGTHEEPLFRASDVGEILQMTNIRASITDFDDTEKVVNSIDTLGGAQSVTFLTEKGLYKVLFKSRKPIAEQFQNWVCEVVKELRLKGSYELKQQLEQVKSECANTIQTNKILDRQKLLLREFGTAGALIYIIRVKTFDDGTYVVKIGESRKGVELRYNEHKKDYPECLLLDCFSVIKSKNFEHFIHHHDKIRGSRFNDLPNHEKEHELFLVGKELTYNRILQIIQENIKHFNEYSKKDFELLEEKIKKLETENKLLQLQLYQRRFESTPFKSVTGKMAEESSAERIELFESVNSQHPHNETTPFETLSNEMVINNDIKIQLQNIEKQTREILNKLNTSHTKTTTGFNSTLVTIGPRLQKINPENLQLIKTYETLSEALNESKHNWKRASIEKAIRENTIYRGFRWMYVDRNKDPSILENILPTKISKTQNLGYIAKVNLDKTKILNVYLDRKTAAAENGYQSCSALDTPVKNGTSSNGYFYILYDRCPENLCDEFEERYGEPILYKDGVGQFDQNNVLIGEFRSKSDCQKYLKMSDKTLIKALNKNIMYNQHYFRKIGNKMSSIPSTV
jgi:prophage antirepressor-like protein